MKFQVYTIGNKNISFEQGIIQKAFNFLINRNEEISIFSHNKINDSIHHIVFHIPDEHISGTKKGGIDTKLPFSQFINAFIINKVLFIEVIRKNYLEIITEFLTEKYKFNISNYTFNTLFIKKCYENFEGIIKQLDLSTIDEDIIDNGIEMLKDNDLTKLAPKYVVDFIAFQPNNNNSLISLDKKGITNVNSNNETFIFDWLKNMESNIEHNNR